MPLFGAPNIEKLKQKQDIPGLIKAMQAQKDPAICQAAAQALGETGSSDAIPPLAAILTTSTSTPTMRQTAAWAIATIGTSQAVEPLLAALNDPEPGIRKLAIQGLQKTGDARALPPLLAMLTQRDSDMAQETFQALIAIGTATDEPARQQHLIEPLGDMLLSSDQQTRLLAATMLEKLGWQPDQTARGATYWVIKGQWNRCIEIGEAAVAPLMTVLKHGDTATRQAAFQALIQIGAPAARPLVAALQDDDTDVRQAAFWALIKIGSPAVDNLVAALHDEHTDIRQAAARALGKIADPRAVVPLIGAFKDPDWSVRRDAYQAIVKTGQAAIQPLIQALNHENEEIQWGAAGTLEALGWKPDQGEIGATYWIVKNEWGKCVDIGLPAVAPLITRLDHWDQNISKEAVGTLIRIGTPAVSPLIAALQHESPEIRKRAAFALGMIGDNRADQPLRALLSDKNKEVGKAASEAVSAIETGEVWRG